MGDHHRTVNVCRARAELRGSAPAALLDQLGGAELVGTAGRFGPELAGAGAGAGSWPLSGTTLGFPDAQLSTKNSLIYACQASSTDVAEFVLGLSLVSKPANARSHRGRSMMASWLAISA